jgi:FdhD protein
MKQSKVKQAEIIRFKDDNFRKETDVIAVEEPLEIRLIWQQNNQEQEKAIAVTMRTPGNDLELALGFLFTEGIITSYNEIDRIWHCERVEKKEEQGNVVKVKLSNGVKFDLKKNERHFYTSSSCGVCGKSSIESVSQKCSVIPQLNLNLDPNLILQLPITLEQGQTVFKYTGGIHASALFDFNGNLELVREDVGRHNALDKIAGAMLFKQEIPLRTSILLVSGRTSFELVQKTLMLGIPILCAVGAPSSLALELAQANNLTLIGFLKNGKFNVYSGQL